MTNNNDGASGMSAELTTATASVCRSALAEPSHQVGLNYIDLQVLERILAEAQSTSAAAERERCIVAVRAVQAGYDRKYGPGPTIEASVCSDCIGAINGLKD